MTWLIGLALKAGVPQRFAKAVTIGVLILLAVGLFFGAKALYDRSVIEDYTSGLGEKVAKEDRKADAKSAEERRVDDARLAAEDQEIKEAITNAGSNPYDRRTAYYECVRKQQAARRDGKPPADC